MSRKANRVTNHNLIASIANAKQLEEQRIEALSVLETKGVHGGTALAGRAFTPDILGVGGAHRGGRTAGLV